jgi:hypothetical protein
LLIVVISNETVISVEEDTRRLTATYPLKKDATKKPLHPIVSMLSRNKKEENPKNGEAVAGVEYRSFDALVISSDVSPKRQFCDRSLLPRFYTSPCLVTFPLQTYPTGAG